MTTKRIKIKQLQQAQLDEMKIIKQAIQQSSLFKNKVELSTIKPFDEYASEKLWNTWISEKGFVTNKAIPNYRFSYHWLAYKLHLQDQKLDNLTDIRIKAINNQAFVYINYKHPFDYITRYNYKIINGNIDNLDKLFIQTYQLVQNNLSDFVENERFYQKEQNEIIDEQNIVIHNLKKYYNRIKSY